MHLQGLVFVRRGPQLYKPSMRLLLGGTLCVCVSCVCVCVMVECVDRVQLRKFTLGVVTDGGTDE